MYTKVILTASALFLGIFGLVFLFLPQEILLYLGKEASPSVVVILQILGSLYMALAFINWMSKANLIGGIYNRPLALGNTLHFAVCAITLLKHTFKNPVDVPGVVLTVMYALFALAFFRIIFTTPKSVTKS